MDPIDKQCFESAATGVESRFYCTLSDPREGGQYVLGVKAVDSIVLLSCWNIS